MDTPVADVHRLRLVPHNLERERYVQAHTHVALELILDSDARANQAVVVFAWLFITIYGPGRVDERLEDQVPVRPPERLLRCKAEVTAKRADRTPEQHARIADREHPGQVLLERVIMKYPETIKQKLNSSSG